MISYYSCPSIETNHCGIVTEYNIKITLIVQKCRILNYVDPLQELMKERIQSIFSVVGSLAVELVGYESDTKGRLRLTVTCIGLEEISGKIVFGESRNSEYN